ncbi:MAG: nucleotidyltransferase domain-containing protein [Candidatus Woesearchaeota archaeon]|nr:nucleotidyltransferase domain-containing protein [Candidatus Woesearchaeota archaeon]
MAKKKFSPKQRAKKHVKKPDDDKIALKFAKHIDKELGEFAKAVILFGSCATHETSKLSDIDVLIIIDDVQAVVTDEVTFTYRKIVAQCQKKVDPRLHINTLKLTTFWEYVKHGDPVVINMLRDGFVLLDRGFFGAAQLLLQDGRVKPSKEAVWTYYSRTAKTLRRARKHILSACVDLYWAAMDASHAALMAVGEMPESPEHVPALLEKVLVKERQLLRPHHPKVMLELYHLQKAITHRELKEMTGEQYDGYWHETLVLVEALRNVVEQHPPTP